MPFRAKNGPYWTLWEHLYVNGANAGTMSVPPTAPFVMGSIPNGPRCHWTPSSAVDSSGAVALSCKRALRQHTQLDIIGE